MITIFLLVLQVVNLVLLIRLNKCGKIVNVHQEYVYTPAPRKDRQQPKRRERDIDSDY